jgi:hypothetical protein
MLSLYTNHPYDVLCIAKTKTHTKKKTLRSSKGKIERVLYLKPDYWQQVQS